MPLPSLKSLREEVSLEEKEPLKLMTITRGGLGNLLFPWLATEALAEDLRSGQRGREVTTSYLSGTPQEKRPDISEYQMFITSCLFESMDIPKNPSIHKESSFLYKSVLHPQPQIKTLVLDGYFQSRHYFEKHRQFLVGRLRHSAGSPLATAEQWLAKTRETYLHTPHISQESGYTVKVQKRLVGVHVRQGDYLDPALRETHYICDGPYWERALRAAVGAGHIGGPEHDIIVIASDDPEAVAKMHAFRGLEMAGYTVIYLKENFGTEKTFWVLAGCDTLLVSNSSFSLGAWYCRDRQSALVAPEQWFGPKGPAYKIHDLVPQETLLVR
jgi:hypothetical protein